MNKAEFEKQNPGLKEKMMQEEAIASAELAGARVCEDCGTSITEQEQKDNNGLCSLCLRALKL